MRLKKKRKNNSCVVPYRTVVVDTSYHAVGHRGCRSLLVLGFGVVGFDVGVSVGIVQVLLLCIIGVGVGVGGLEGVGGGYTRYTSCVWRVATVVYFIR